MIDAAKTHLQQQSVDPHVIDLEADTQSRCALDPETLEDYAARYRAGLYLPPVDVFYDGARYFCGDGHHRIAAARAAEIDEIEVLIHDGGREEAALFSCAANQEHGKRRTNADKRAATEKCMRLRPFWSNSLIAEHCGVSPTTVATVRATLQLGESTVRQGADGRTYNTAGIGKKPAPKPAVNRLEDTDEVDAAVRALADYVAARSQRLPIDEARSWLQLEIGVQIEDDDWEEILDEGKHKSLWQVADGCLQPRTGRVYTPDEVLSTLEDMLREAGGKLGQADAREILSRELCALTDEQWGAVLDLGADEHRVSLDLNRDELVYLEDGSEGRAQVTSAEADTDGDRDAPAQTPIDSDDHALLLPVLVRYLDEERERVLGSASTFVHQVLQPVARKGLEREAGCTLTDKQWAALLRAGESAGLLCFSAAPPKEFLRDFKRTRRYDWQPSVWSHPPDTDGDGSAEYSEQEQPGGEGDEDRQQEQDADEGPVLPSDPDDPAVQGHTAAEDDRRWDALEEGVYVDADTDTDEEDEEPGGVEGTTHRPHGEGVGQPSPATEKAGSIPAPGTSLPNDERAEDDAYYTPEKHTRGLLRWLDEALFAGSPPRRVLEPSVGSGNFLLSARDLWESAKLDALDLNPNASGFDYADTFTVCDFFETELAHEYDLVVGNPPYKCDLVRWVERSLKCGRVVCYLLRGTFLGSRKRSAWHRSSGLAHVVVVSPRPKWEGPGARKQTDTSDSLLFVWIRGYQGKPALHFLDLHEGEDLDVSADEEEE